MINSSSEPRSRGLPDPSDLPISKHTTVLGVDITAHQEAMHYVMQGGCPKGGLSPDIEIETWQAERHRHQRCRRELAAWARRNLFINGAGPR